MASAAVDLTFGEESFNSMIRAEIEKAHKYIAIELKYTYMFKSYINKDLAIYQTCFVENIILKSYIIKDSYISDLFCR